MNDQVLLHLWRFSFIVENEHGERLGCDEGRVHVVTTEATIAAALTAAGEGWRGGRLLYMEHIKPTSDIVYLGTIYNHAKPSWIEAK